MTKQTRVKFNYSFSDEEFDELIKLKNIINSLSEGCQLIITNLPSRKIIIDQYIKLQIPKIPKEIDDILEKAQMIEEKLNIKFKKSLNKILETDIQDINELHCILSKGKVSKKFSMLPISISKEDLIRALSNKGFPQPNHLKFFYDDVIYEILGKEINLGKMERFFPSVIIKDGLEDLQEKLKTWDDKLIEIEFIPGSTDEFEESYPNYLLK